MRAQILSDLSDPSRSTEDAPADQEDGRRARRDRNRDAVVDALLELYGEGELDPSAAQIAERAGSSPRSVFRYFDDVDDLCRAAITRQLSRVGALAEPAAHAGDPLDQRVSALVASRLALFDTIGNAGVVSRIRAPFQPVIAEMLAQARLALRSQLAELFADELSALPRSSARSTLAAIDVLCSFESYRLLRDDQRLSRAQAGATIEDAVHGLLGAAR